MPLPIHSVVLAFTAAALLALSGCGSGSSQSNANPEPTVTPVAALAAPASVIATTDAGQVTLQWNPVKDAASYAIYMDAPATRAALVSKVKYADTVTSPYTVNGLTRGQTYSFTIVAITADGSEGEESAAIPVRLSMTATALVAGAEHSCALLSDGAVKCWGRNDASQLGSAVVDYSASPVAVPGVANAKAISAAGQHSCAVLNDGSLQCWGTYGEGATAVTFTSPIVISGVASAVSVTSSRDTDCALLSDATVACFSPVPLVPQFAPRLSKAPALTPAGAVVNGVVNAKQIAAGVDFTCALLSNGQVTCWNVGGFGSPQVLANITGATAITARGNQACALMPTGVQCWQHAAFEFSASINFTFTQVQNTLSGINGIAVGTGVSPNAYFAVMEGGTVQAWNVLPTVAVGGSPGDCFGCSGSVTGSATHIQTTIASSPVALTGLVFPADNFITIGSGAAKAPPIAFNSEWSAQSPLQAIWVGQSVSGEGAFSTSRLTNPSSATTSPSVAAPLTPIPLTPVSLPVLVTDLVNVAAIANGNAHGCALLLSGDVMCWGDNQYGQVGNGEISATFTAPVAINDL